MGTFNRYAAGFIAAVILVGGVALVVGAIGGLTVLLTGLLGTLPGALATFAIVVVVMLTLGFAQGLKKQEKK